MAPALSHRGATVPPSAIRKLVPHAVEATARGVHVYHLNIGQPDVASPALAYEALRAFEQDPIAYTRSGGDPAYVETLRGYYRRWGVDVDADEINVTTGGSEALLFAMMALLDPGDEVIIAEPFYTNYAAFATMVGARVVPITTRVEDGFHLPPRAAIDAKVTKRTRALLLCHPSNPTGTVYTRAELDMVAGLCREHDLWLLSDEVYREFVFDPNADTYRTALAIPDMADRVVVADSVSKRFSMCGARVGCALSKNRDLMAALLRMSNARLCPPGLGQWAALGAHDAPAAYMSEAIDEYRRRRDVLFELLSTIPGVITRKPEGAFYAIARLPVADTEHFARWLLTDFQQDGETVMVAPAGGFYATPGLGHDEVRIAYVLATPQLRRAVALLAAALDAYKGLQVPAPSGDAARP